jgi:hypothetical protein
MPRHKKKAPELTTQEVFRKMFPKKVREEAEKTALDSRKRPTKGQSK